MWYAVAFEMAYPADHRRYLYPATPGLDIIESALVQTFGAPALSVQRATTTSFVGLLLSVLITKTTVLRVASASAVNLMERYCVPSVSRPNPASEVYVVCCGEDMSSQAAAFFFPMIIWLAKQGIAKKMIRSIMNSLFISQPPRYILRLQ